MLFIIVIIAILQSRYIKNFISGPYDLSFSELDSIKDVSMADRYFVRVTGTKIVDTGAYETTIRKINGVETDRRLSGRFYALLIGPMKT